VVAALAAALLERWSVAQPVLWALAAALVPNLLAAFRRLSCVQPGAPLTLFVLLVPASLTWNDDPFFSYRSILTFAAFIVIALWLVVWETPTSALALLGAGAAVTAGASVVVAVVLPDLIVQSNPGAFQGIFTHKNWLALAVGYLIIAVMYMGRQQRFVRWSALAAAVVLLVLAQSLGAYFAIGTTILFFGARASARRLMPIHQRILGFVAILAIITTVLVGLRELYVAAVGIGEGRDIDRRFQLWNVALEYAAERPLLGWGWRGTWSNSRGVTGDIARDMGGFPGYGAHNGYVDVFLQVGLVGAALLVFLLLRVIWPRLNDPSLLGWSALALFSALFTISDSFLAGHVPILIIITGWLFGRNPQLWCQTGDFDVHQVDQTLVMKPTWPRAETAGVRHRGVKPSSAYMRPDLPPPDRDAASTT
jgi:O-antigen ligase